MGRLNRRFPEHRALLAATGHRFTDNVAGVFATFAALRTHTQALAHFAQRRGALVYFLAYAVIRDGSADTNVHIVLAGRRAILPIAQLKYS